jgi:hypothetical protein
MPDGGPASHRRAGSGLGRRRGVFPGLPEARRASAGRCGPPDPRCSDRPDRIADSRRAAAVIRGSDGECEQSPDIGVGKRVGDAVFAGERRAVLGPLPVCGAQVPVLPAIVTPTIASPMIMGATLLTGASRRSGGCVTSNDCGSIGDLSQTFGDGTAPLVARRLAS